MVTFDRLVDIHYYLFLMIFFDSIIRLIIRPSKVFGYRRLMLGFLSLFPIMEYNGIQLFSFQLSLGIQQAILFFIAVSRLRHLSFLFQPLRSNPTQSFVGGFILFIFIGAFLLMMPMAHTEPITFFDALFTSASAVCVTGLSVFDVGTVLSPVGQLILLLLIQVGGLGIMTFYALVTISLNQRFLSRESQELQRGWSTENIKETFGIIRSIFVVTFVLEFIGAFIIFFALPDTISSLKAKLFYAVFHSVSAFCNAGFSLFENSLGVFSGNAFILGVFSLLILLGGIGFPVIFELYHRYFLGDRSRLKLQTRMALFVTMFLIIVGLVVIYFQSIFSVSMPISEALFHSVSSRTAGFSVQDIASYSASSLWFILLLMFIGASPGSTGGGIKTTTFGLLIVSLFNTIRGHDRVHVFDRHVKSNLIFKALAILTMSFFIIFFAFFVLLITEPQADFFPLLFEAVSAFATVGFSLGVTSDLSNVGKVIIIVLMFFGRVGPLTFAVALTRKPKPINYKLPDETILLG